MAAAVLAFLTPGLSRAGEVDLTAVHREITPIAKRLKGSGVQCRTLASLGGSRHKLKLASLRIRLGERVWVRAGAGAASHSVEPHLLAQRDGGIAYAGALQVALWQGAHFAIDLNLSAARAEYVDHAFADGSVLVALRKL
jgi:hypothetical protein